MYNFYEHFIKELKISTLNKRISTLTKITVYKYNLKVLSTFSLTKILKYLQYLKI